jgi:hypothetical protein
VCPYHNSPLCDYFSSTYFFFKKKTCDYFNFTGLKKTSNRRRLDFVNCGFCLANVNVKVRVLVVLVGYFSGTKRNTSYISVAYRCLFVVAIKWKEKYEYCSVAMLFSVSNSHECCILVRDLCTFSWLYVQVVGPTVLTVISREVCDSSVGMVCVETCVSSGWPQMEITRFRIYTTHMYPQITFYQVPVG